MRQWFSRENSFILLGPSANGGVISSCHMWQCKKGLTYLKNRGTRAQPLREQSSPLLACQVQSSLGTMKFQLLLLSMTAAKTLPDKPPPFGLVSYHGCEGLMRDQTVCHSYVESRG